MKTLLKAAVAFACVSLLSFPVKAENYDIPKDNEGNIPADINLVGCDVFTATAATAMGSTRPVTVYGYSVTSEAITNFAFLRDSSTLNTTSNIKLALGWDAQCLDKIANTSSASQVSCHVRLPVPVIFRNGISINLATIIGGSGHTGAQARPRWMFYVRYNDIGVVPGKKPSDADASVTVDNKGVN